MGRQLSKQTCNWQLELIFSLMIQFHSMKYE